MLHVLRQHHIILSSCVPVWVRKTHFPAGSAGESPEVLGSGEGLEEEVVVLDDWAGKRGRRYGTIVCDRSSVTSFIFPRPRCRHRRGFAETSS